MIKDRLSIYVEGAVDKTVVEYLLFAAGLDDGVGVIVCNGKENVAKRIASLRDSTVHKSIALIDADEMSVADSRKLAEKQLGYPTVPVYCAVPTIESWLFADDISAKRAARSEQAERTLDRAPLPEMIPYPKQLATYILPKGPPSEAYAFLRLVDISIATARSSSLRAFLEGVAKALGRDAEFSISALSRSVSRDAFSTLLRELPSEKIAWKTLDGTEIHAGELSKAVAEGTEIGKQYVTEVLRIARDIVARKAR